MIFDFASVASWRWTKTPIVIDEDDGGNSTDRLNHFSHQVPVVNPGAESENEIGDAGNAIQKARLTSD